jgi:peptidyl-prolyl cis-trans isomerase C
MKLRLSLPILFVLAALLVSGCGGGSSAKLGSNDVAVVGSQQVTKDRYNSALDQERSSLKAQGRAFPKAGSTDYAAMKNQILTVLAQQAEFAAEAEKLGIKITDKNVQTRLDQIKKQYFGGSQTKYLAQLKQQGFTDAQVRTQINEQLLEQALFNKVTKDVTVSDADVHTYYVQHTSQYQVPASRDVREILVGKNKQTLAQQIYDQLKGGADFAALAKKYSQDPGSKNSGGKFTAKQGADVPEFDKAVFAATAKTNELLKPVETAQYGWFVIQPLAAVKPAKTTPEKQAAVAIRAQLAQQKKNQAMTDWVDQTSKDYCNGSKIKYQVGYQPSPDPCAALTTTSPTTT